MDKILKIEKIEKYYGNKSSLTKAIDNISFEVEKGEFVAIMGASGSGKTTLLNCISTIDKVTSGHIYVDGCDITGLRGNKLNEFRREKLGFIFQDFNLLDTLTGYENISLALSILGEKESNQKEKIKDVAEKLGISKILNKYPYQMSGGEKQRIASARAIITNPKLILADEPTGALDSKTSEKALLTYLLSRTTAEYPTMLSMNRALASLYGASITPIIEKTGEAQVLKLVLSALDDRFTLDSEKVCEKCIDLLCSCLFRPDVDENGFKEENTEREKRLLIEKIDSEKDEKRIYALNRMIEEMCCNEPYGKSKYGKKEKIEKLTGKEVFDVCK